MTKVYTYSVKMVVQVMGEFNEEEAKDSLDKNGGYVSQRTVKLLNVTDIEPLGYESLISQEEER